MSKILSQSGNSLADIYNVEGSIAGIETLETRELPIVHELGATVFAERFAGRIRRLSSGAINQSSNFDVTLTAPSPGPFRVLGMSVLANQAARVTKVMVAMQDAEAGRELPVLLWDINADAERAVRIVDDGGGAATLVALIPSVTPQVPTLGFGSDQLRQVGNLVMRGSTEAFGAGDVTILALLYLGFTERRGLSSRGLPVPSW